MSSHSNCFRDGLGLPRLTKRKFSRTGLSHTAIRFPKTTVSSLIPICPELLLAPRLNTRIPHQNISKPGCFSRIPLAVYAPPVSGASMTSGQDVPRIGPHMAVVERRIQCFFHESERLVGLYPTRIFCIVYSRVSIVHSRPADSITEVTPG